MPTNTSSKQSSLGDEHRYDLIVVGAGLIGASFASLMAQSSPKLRIAVVDRAKRLEPPIQSNQRVVALGRVATDMLDCVGVFKQLDESKCFEYRRMFVWDESSVGELELNSSDTVLPLLGHMIDSAYCNYLLQQSLLDLPNVDCCFDTAILSLHHFSKDDELASLETTLGVLSAPLIVAADGANSALRRLAKIPTNLHSYEQFGIVAKISSSLVHQDTAWQRFMEHGPLGVLPLADNQCSIVWSCKNRRAEELLAMSDENFCLELSDALDNRLGQVSLVSTRQMFPLKSHAATRYFNGRVALMGDAAHSIHPLAGQGANLGFKDGMLLLKLLVAANRSSSFDLTKLLSQYETQRKSDNRATDQAMSLLNAAFLYNNPIWSAVRGLGMLTVSKSSALKQLLTEQAVGR